jgi:hypothetical protein
MCWLIIDEFLQLKFTSRSMVGIPIHEAEQLVEKFSLEIKMGTHKASGLQGNKRNISVL